MYLPALSFTVSLPSSMSCRMATLVSAFDCEAMRKIGVHGHLRPASLSRPADGAFVHGFPVAQYQRDDAADAAVVHVGVEQGVDAREALGGEARTQRLRCLRGQECGDRERRIDSTAHGGREKLLRHLVPRADEGAATRRRLADLPAYSSQRGTFDLYSSHAAPCVRASHGSSPNTTRKWNASITLPA